MQIPLGFCATSLKYGEQRFVSWETNKVVNHHMLLVGMSGTGKTHQLRKIIGEMLKQQAEHPIRIHVFDVHGDIAISGASSVLFSEQTHYGLNPLKVDPDKHAGGVRKRIQAFISAISQTSRQLGTKQEAVLRNLLQDLYTKHGFKADDPSTWEINEAESSELITDERGEARLYLEVPWEDKDLLKELKVGARWDTEKSCWYIRPEAYQGSVTRWSPRRTSRQHPTVADALRLGRNILETSFLGTGINAITYLEIANRTASRFRKKLLDSVRKGNAQHADEEASAELDKAKQKAIEAYTDYIDSISTGKELTDLMKYESTDVLKSVVERLENLNGIGIFKNQTPPFDRDNPVWRYDLKALSIDERKLFVNFRLEEIFQGAIRRGEQSDLTEVVILDEAHIYANDNPEHIVNLISKEARKFGLGMICASQSPTHFSEDFISSVGTKVVLGIDEMFWRGAQTKMRLSEDALKWVRPHQSILVQMKTIGETRGDWRWVRLPSARKPTPSPAEV